MSLGRTFTAAFGAALVGAGMTENLVDALIVSVGLSLVMAAWDR